MKTNQSLTIFIDNQSCRNVMTHEEKHIFNVNRPPHSINPRKHHLIFWFDVECFGQGFDGRVDRRERNVLLVGNQQHHNPLHVKQSDRVVLIQLHKWREFVVDDPIVHLMASTKVWVGERMNLRGLQISFKENCFIISQHYQLRLSHTDVGLQLRKQRCVRGTEERNIKENLFGNRFKILTLPIKWNNSGANHCRRIVIGCVKVDEYDVTVLSQRIQC